MKFYNDEIFHVYNQGNNRIRIFCNERNYGFFLWKFKTYTHLFADIISYCLMPNHFHFQLLVKETEVVREHHRDYVVAETVKRLRSMNRYREGIEEKLRSYYRSASKHLSLNEAIGIVQRSYTRAFNNEVNRTGSLFRGACKAKCKFEDNSFLVAGLLDYDDDDKHTYLGYAYHCINYIHQNPVAAQLVKHETDWEFSSAAEYAGKKENEICNLEVGKEILKMN